MVVDLVAFLAALDDYPDHRDAVGRALCLALRLGFVKAAPEYLDTLRETVADHTTDNI